jgi:hypothetical protein
MRVLCHAMDDVEVMFIHARLQSHSIPFTLLGENFGSLYPGVQIAMYNERRFLVPEEFFDQARDVLAAHRENYEPGFVNLEVKSKIRILLETIIWGWCIPYGIKKNH